MALQIWLPLDGDLRNQGLVDTTVNNNGATIDNNGKIGKCYSFNGSSYIDTGYKESIGTGDFSISAWIYITQTSGKTYQCIVGNKGTGAASVGFAIYWNQNQKKFLWSTADGSSATEIWSTDTFDTIIYNSWHHIIMCRNNNDARKGYFYLDGVRKEIASIPVIRNITSTTSIKIGSVTPTAAAYYFTGKINDIRIYDHALSIKEVKELSKGLILHYPMNINLNQLENAYSNPYFNTSSASGGWNHWGGSGHQGTYGQNTNKEYIFNKNQTYSHWVADASNATKNYLLYQSPAFDGGYRSIQFIIKEENSLPIDETICYPDWNARDGGVPLQLWTSIEYLGDGFYLCKCEGIHQNGSNNLIGVYITIGHKIYISEAYLENNKELCSYIRPMDFTTVIDCAPAGNTNDGTIVGTITAVADSPRYESSYHFDGASYLKTTSPFGEIRTISLWAKWDSIPSGQSVIFIDYKSYLGLGLMSSGILCSSRTSSKVFNKSNIVANTWYHFVIICPNGPTNAERKLYINGQEQTALTGTSNWSYSIDELQVGKRSSTNDGFKGKISDFRVYCTVLSAEDIKELYDTAAQIDKDGNVYAYEFKEV